MALVASNRICSEPLSSFGRRKLLPIEKSIWEMRGPRRMFLPALPKVKAAGWANAAGLNHRSIVGLSTLESPTTFGNQVPACAPLLFDPLTVGVNTLPDWTRNSDDNRQPPMIASTTPPRSANFWPLPNGSV